MLIGLLNSKYTFDTFIVGASNRSAHAQALAIGEVASNVSNPLYIYGGVGTGKTHLLHAIAHLANKRKNNLRIMYDSLDVFLDDLVTAIRNDKTNEFEEKCCNLDILLLDNLQFLHDKEHTQRKLFLIFEQIVRRKKQIVLAGDCHPKALPALTTPLAKKLQRTHLVKIERAEFQTKVGIIKGRALAEKVLVPDEIAFFIADNTDQKCDARQLEGLVVRLLARAAFKREPISLKLA